MSRLKTLFANRPFPLHPLLFAAFPVLNLWAANIEEDVAFGDVLPYLAGAVAAAAVLTLILTPLFRSARKAGFAATAIAVVVFGYGYTFKALEGWTVAGVTIGRRGVVIALAAGVAVAAVALAARAKKYVPEITKGLNVIGAVLVLLNVAQIGYYNIRSNPAGEIALPNELRNHPLPVSSTRQPDIYFFIFDTYAGEKTLTEQFRFDNRPFVDFLEAKGFYVANRSTANYPRTLLSLASSLNMRYLDFLTPRMGENTGDTAPLKQMVQRHAVGRYLKDLGYKYVHLGSWWGPTAKSPIADVNLKFKSGSSEFGDIFLRETALGDVVGENFRKREYSRAIFNFQALEDVSKNVSGPKFVFAHFLVPHGPFVLDRDGDYVSLDVQSKRTRERNYLEQVMWLNQQLTKFVERRLAAPKKERPVIILQSDEGPYEGEPTKWSQRPRLNVLYRKFFNLNAWYLPGVKRSELYPSVSSVNTFRVLFNIYFDAKLPLLRDENYAFADLKKHLYRFYRMTPLIRNSG